MIGCEHKWKWLRNNCTWTSSGASLDEKPPEWAHWYAEYQCELCGDTKCKSIPAPTEGGLHV